MTQNLDAQTVFPLSHIPNYSHLIRFFKYVSKTIPDAWEDIQLILAQNYSRSA